MLGAIIGDVIGSVFEFSPIKVKDFPLFVEDNNITDDSILTMAIYTSLEKCQGNYTKLSRTVARELIKWYAIYPMPMGGYGGGFANWAVTSLQSYRVLPAYNSFENGAAMRVSPVAYFAESLEHCIELSRMVTQVTHNHPEGIKGAEATAVTIYLALHGKSRSEIAEHVRAHYYPLNENCNRIRNYYHFEASCQETVPQSIQAFLESTCYEDAIRISISLGGDADTMGAITGSIAEAYYGVPKKLESKILTMLDGRCNKVAQKMIEKRTATVHRYLERDEPLFKNECSHSRYNGADMDGNPIKDPPIAVFKFQDVHYSSRHMKHFVKIDKQRIETPMNDEEFLFFIDELRLYLHMRFRISVEDFYDDMLLEMSKNYWNGV